MRIILDSYSPNPRPLAVVFYRTATGNEPVREWLKSLPEDERKQIGADILTVQYGWPLGLPLVDSLGDGLWEVRSRLATRIARTLFFVNSATIILLHGFIKKTRATPDHDLNIARKRKRDYEQAQESPSRK
jgi:phage-related protein